MHIVSPLITNREPPVFGDPSQRPLHDPPVPSQLFGALHTLSGYAPLDASFSQSSRTLFVVVGCVGVYLLWAEIVALLVLVRASDLSSDCIH